MNQSSIPDRIATSGLLAIDVGNSRLKMAWYASRELCPSESSEEPGPGIRLPIVSHTPASPEDRFELEGGEDRLDEDSLIDWLETLPLSSARCLIASVQRTRLHQLLAVLTRGPFPDPKNPPQVLCHGDLPMVVRAEHSEKIGIDRLLNGVQANRLRKKGWAAIVVSMGSAITVDYVAPDGAFEGGAILPGLTLSANALHDGTDLLPRIVPQDIPMQPPAIGRNTLEAIQGGLYWGAVGAISELLHQQLGKKQSPCDIFVTGGDALKIVDPLRTKFKTVSYQEQMVLDGIWFVSQEGS